MEDVSAFLGLPIGLPTWVGVAVLAAVFTFGLPLVRWAVGWVHRVAFLALIIAVLAITKHLLFAEAPQQAAPTETVQAGDFGKELH